MDLETLHTEYTSAIAEMDQKLRIYESAVRARDDAANALVEAIQDAGLTSYGPMTSTLEPGGPFGEIRRFWKMKEY